ncbi:hypothetical protein DRN85_02430 [Methanosarcinales archaeon]|nr:MAG: hypothetical protein DRN85_02430 [Methanosarcinales archaeon]
MCGNVVEVLEAGYGELRELVCCGQPLELIKEAS